MKSIQGMTRFRKKFENSSIKVQIINYTPFPIYFKIELNMETYTDIKTKVEAVKDTFTPDLYEHVCDTLEALELLCRKREAHGGRKCFMSESVEALVMYLLALIKKPSEIPSFYVLGLYENP